MTYQIAFPDFDPSTMPEIPAGFVDNSWAGDTCPCFINEKRDMILFIDYADSQKHLREFNDADRYSILIGEKSEFSSNDYEVILAIIHDI